MQDETLGTRGPFVVLPSAFESEEIMPEAWTHVQAQLERLRRKSPGALFAFRSSAQASFAGEFETILEIDSDDEVREMIDTVRRSRRSERVKAYSQAKGMDIALDLSIQPQVINLQ
jgi:pyruvate,water dikinase